jgi:hypothetical protein
MEQLDSVVRVRDRVDNPIVLVLVAVVVLGVVTAAVLSVGGLLGGTGSGGDTAPGSGLADEPAPAQNVGASVVEEQPQTIDWSVTGTNYFSTRIAPGEADRLRVSQADANTVEADDVQGPAVFLDPEVAGSTPAFFVCFRNDVLCPSLGETVDISAAAGDVLIGAGVQRSRGQQIGFEHELTDGDTTQTLTTGPTGIGTEAQSETRRVDSSTNGELEVLETRATDDRDGYETTEPAVVETTLRNPGDEDRTITEIRLDDTTHSEAVRISVLEGETDDNHEVTVVTDGGLAGGIGTDGSLEESLRFDETAPFEVDATIPAGESAELTLGDFRVEEFAAGTGVDMDGERLTFTLGYADGSSQEFTIRVGESGTVGSDAGSFEITDSTFTGKATVGDEVTASAEITNTGDRTGSAEIRYEMKGTDIRRSLDVVTLDSGDSTSVELRLENGPSKMDPGTYRHEIRTPQDTFGKALTVRKSGPIEVTVTDAETGEPVEDATVRAVHDSGTTFNASSGSGGTYVVGSGDDLPSGTYTVSVDHPNYSSSETTVSGSEDGTTVTTTQTLSSGQGGLLDGDGLLLVGLLLALFVFVLLAAIVVGHSGDRLGITGALDVDRLGTSLTNVVGLLPVIGTDSSGRSAVSGLRSDRERSPLLSEDGTTSRLRRPWLPASVRETLGSLFGRDTEDSERE